MGEKHDLFSRRFVLWKTSLNRKFLCLIKSVLNNLNIRSLNLIILRERVIFIFSRVKLSREYMSNSPQGFYKKKYLPWSQVLASMISFWSSLIKANGGTFNTTLLVANINACLTKLKEKKKIKSSETILKSWVRKI